MNKTTRYAKTALKFALVFGLLFFLAKKGFISVDSTQAALKQWKIIVPAIASLFLTAMLGGVRWQWLLRAQGIHLTWKRTMQLTFIGNFFNIALPGAISGDFVKAFYAGEEIPGGRAKVFGSILFDRVAGVSALVLVSASTLLISYRSYQNSLMLNAILVLVVLAASCVILFYAYLFVVRERHDPLLKCFRLVEKLMPRAEVITRIYLSLRHYHHCRGAVLKSVGLSVVIHLIAGWASLCFAHALGETQLSIIPVWIVVPLGSLVTVIPLAPAGVGTGNVAFLYFFHLIGSERGADIFSLVALSNILVGAFGGLVYFTFKNRTTLPKLSQVEELPTS